MSRYSLLFRPGFIVLFSILCMPCFLAFSLASTESVVPIKFPFSGIVLMGVLYLFFVLPLVWSNLKPFYLHMKHFREEADKRRLHRRKIFALDRTFRQKVNHYHRELGLNRFRSLSDLQKMTPKKFEHHVAYIFQQMGYQTYVLGGSGDRGIDVEARNGEELVIVQCKRYKEDNKVGSPAVRNFIGAMSISQANRGYFVTTSTFTRPAQKDAATVSSVTLVDGSGIVDWWQKYKLGPYKNLTYPEKLEYPPPPPTMPPPSVPAVVIMGFSVWQWVVLMILSELSLGVMSVLVALILS